MVATLLGVLLAGRPTTTAAQATAADRLRMVEIVDHEGFGQPIVAFRFLAPAGWTVEGGVGWNPGAPCSGDVVTSAAQVTSPDGGTVFEIFPVYSSGWEDDPYLQQFLRQTGLTSINCPARPPYDARQFIREILVPGFRAGARVEMIERDAETARLQLEKAEREVAGAGMWGAELSADAAQARISYMRDGQRFEERLVATTYLLSMRGVMGGYSHINMAERIFGFRAPAGRLAESEGLFATMLGSFQVNPVWRSAVDQVFRDITTIQARGAAQRSRIWSRTMDEIGDMQMETWRNSQESNDRISESFSRYIRGVEIYVDPASGRTMEFESGTTYVWTNSFDEYIPTDDPFYSPGDTRSGIWTRYEVSR